MEKLLHIVILNVAQSYNTYLFTNSVESYRTHTLFVLSNKQPSVSESVLSLVDASQNLVHCVSPHG